MGGLIEAASGALDRRLFSTTFLPMAAFVGALLAVVAWGTGWAAAAARWSALTGEVRLLAGLVVLVLVLLLTQALDVLYVSIVRLYEGYWAGIPFAARLRALLVTRRARHVEALAWGSPERLLYPADRGELTPTALGSVLRGAELHSAERYSLEAVTAWPRLYPLLPETFRQDFAVSAAQLQLAVVSSALGGCFAVAGGLLAAWTLPLYAAASCVCCGAVVAWLAYRAAVQCAAAYGQLFRGAFDVHRWLLLDAMGLDRPADLEAEQARWTAISQLWVRGMAVDPSQLGFPGTEPGTAPGLEPPPRAAAASTRRRRLVGPLLLVLCAGSCAAVVVQSQGPVAARDLRPYQVITAADVRGGGAALVGRYTLRRIASGDRISTNGLGPRLPSGLLAGRTIVVVKAPAPAVFQGQIIRVSTSGKAGSADAVVLEAAGTAADRTLTLAVRPETLSVLAGPVLVTTAP
ncbi:hypothetical protein GCM10022221_13610 [Actinocorallia aurea]